MKQTAAITAIMLLYEFATVMISLRKIVLKIRAEYDRTCSIDRYFGFGLLI